MATHLLDFGIRYAGFWESAGGGSIQGLFAAAEDALSDSIISIDELAFWNWEWTGNDEVEPFSISSEEGEAIALTSPDGLLPEEQNTAIGADFVDPDGLDQGIYTSGAGNQIIDLNAIFVEDLEAGTVSEGDAAAVDASISVGAIKEFDLKYVSFWEDGGAIEGSFSAIDADAEDGIVSPDELLSWELSWTGNDVVEAFSISSDDGSVSALLSPGGLLTEGPNTPIDGDFNDPDGVDQGTYESGEGDQLIDLGALIVEDFANGTVAQGDAAEGTIFVGKFIDFSVLYSEFWSSGGSVTGSFSTTEAAAADGVVSIDELIAWEWNWTGNDEVDAFSISSDEGEAIALLPPGGFLLDDMNTAIDEEFTDPDGLDQGVYTSGPGDQIIDLGALIIQDLEAGTFTEGVSSEGNILVAAGETETLDFEGDGMAAGMAVTDQLEEVTVSTDTEFGAMIFDTSNPTGGDADLTSDDLGNVLIISEDGDSSDADDSAAGGTISMVWDDLVGVFSVGLLDIDEPGSVATFYDADDNVLDTFEILDMGDNSYQTVNIGVSNVARMDLELAGSGALANIELVTVTDTSIA